MFKQRLKMFLTWNVVDPLLCGIQENIFQNIFNNQCANLGIQNRFYPIGAAANYSLMYLIFRIMDENDIKDIIELGSGQTTLLIEQLLMAKNTKETVNHISYEQDVFWYNHLRQRLKNVSYRHRELVQHKIDQISCEFYANVEYRDFDFLLVDGPIGVDKFSRFGCVELIRRNTKNEFIVVIDDAERPGEKDTVGYICEMFRRKNIDFKLSYLQSLKTQAIITTPKYYHVSYY